MATSTAPPIVVYIIGLGRAGSMITYNILKKMNDITTGRTNIIVKGRLIDTAKDAFSDIRKDDPDGNIIPDDSMTSLFSFPTVQPYIRSPRDLIEQSRKEDRCSWVPWNELNIGNLLRSIASGAGGVGRNRILSRIVVECVPNVRNILRDIIFNDLRELRDMVISRGININNFGILIVVAFGAGGGTGSGTYLTLLSILNEVNSRLGVSAKVLPLIVIPNEPQTDVIIAANGYATLKDLACSAKVNPEAFASITMPLAAGFNEAHIDAIQASNIFDYIDEKIANFILAVHKTPVVTPDSRAAQGAITHDWNNIFLATYEEYRKMGGKGGAVPVAVFDTVELAVPVDQLIEYFRLKMKIDSLREELVQANVDKETLAGFVSQLESSQFSSTSGNQVNIIKVLDNILKNYNLATKLAVTTGISEEINRRIVNIIELVKNKYTNLIDVLSRVRNLDGVEPGAKDSISDINTIIRKSITRESGIRRLLDPFFIESIENTTNQAISNARNHCEHKLIFKGRCKRHVERLRDEVFDIINDIRGNISRYNMYTNLLANIEMYKGQLEREIEEVRRELERATVKANSILDEITSKNNSIVRRVNPGKHILLFTKDGINRLYSKYLEPYRDNEEMFWEEVKKLARKGISFFARGDEKGPYITTNESRLINNVVGNALQELSIRNLPLNIKETSLIDALRERLAKRVLWLYVNSEDQHLLRNLNITLAFADQIERIDHVDDNIGPRIVAAQIIVPVMLSWVEDLRELERAYESMPNKLLRHAYPEAAKVNLSLLESDASEFDEACEKARAGTQG